MANQSCAHRRLRESPADHASSIQHDTPYQSYIMLYKHNFDDKRLKRKGHP